MSMLLFSLRKAIGLLLMPLGLAWLACLAGALVCGRRGQQGPARAFLALFLALGCAGNVYVSSALCAGLEGRFAPVRLEGLEPFDAVFVLGGGADQDPAGAPELSSSGDRVYLAARLWHAGKARLLVASGMSHAGVHGIQDGGRETRELWRALGVPDRAILVVSDVAWNTREEIHAYARLRASHHWRRMALVTSATHLPRALALASREGLELTPLGCDWRGRHRPFLPYFLVPQAWALEDSTRACWEYLGRWTGG
jgi:uncharacterized SAM-binding protein YcdF (DUF218 family)